MWMIFLWSITVFQAFASANIHLTTTVTWGNDGIEITCFPNNNGILYRDISSIQLDKNTTEISYSGLVALRNDILTGQITVDWIDPLVRERANASGDLSTPRNSRLTFRLSSGEVACSDEGAYRCTITGTDLLGTAIEEVGEAYLDIQGTTPVPDTTEKEEIPPMTPNIDLVSPVILGASNLEISCFPENNGILFRDVNSIILSKNTSTLPYSGIVTVYFDRTLGVITQWLDPAIQSRANATGDISTPGNSKLTMSITSQKTECADEGAYRCAISGLDLLGTVKEETGEAYLDIQSLPEDLVLTAFSPIYGTSDTAGVYPGGTTLNLTCSGKVGDPPQPLHWCIQNGTSQPIVPYIANISQTEPELSAPCTYAAVSSLVYAVNDNDYDVILMCVSSSSPCGIMAPNATYRIVAGNPVEAEVHVEAESPLTQGLDNLMFTCRPSDNGDAFRSITSILLSVNRFGNIGFTYIPWLEVKLNISTGESDIIWYRSSLQSRASASGNVEIPETSFLSLSINTSGLECNDQGRFKCIITGTSMKGEATSVENSTLLDIQTLPEQVELNASGSIVAESSSVAIVNPGTILNLTCSGLVGDPPQPISWCIQNGTDQSFVPYPFPGHIEQSPPILSSPCTYFGKSKLLYTVGDTDFDVTFMCQVGMTSECGAGMFNTTYTVFSGDEEEPQVQINAASVVTVDSDSLTITCSPSSIGGRFKEIQSIYLSLNPFGDLGFTFIPMVEVRYNRTFHTNDVIWYSPTLQNRSVVSGDVIDPVSGRLTLTISSVLCEDQGKYKCEIYGTTLIGGNIKVQNSTLVDVQSLPETIMLNSSGSIVAESSSAAIVNPGTILNLTCSGLVGDPPQPISWCIQNGTDQSFVPYRFPGHIEQSPPTLSSPCTYFGKSKLLYLVGDTDFNVTLMCQVGITSECGAGVFNATYTVFSGDEEEPQVQINAASVVTIDSDSLTITCSPSSNGGRFKEIQSIYLSLNPFGDLGFTFIPKVEVRYNGTFHKNDVIWYSPTLQNRSLVSGDVIDPVSGGLTLTVNSAQCEDQGKYKCEIYGTTLIGGDIEIQNSTLVDVQSMPGTIELVQVTSSTSSSNSSFPVGTSLNLTCNAVVGDPPQPIRWCVRNITEDPWEQGDNIQSSLGQVSQCSYSQSSTLIHTVTVDTQFLCEVGGSGACGSGIYNDSYSAYVYTTTTTSTGTVSSAVITVTSSSTSQQATSTQMSVGTSTEYPSTIPSYNYPDMYSSAMTKGQGKPLNNAPISEAFPVTIAHGLKCYVKSF